MLEAKQAWDVLESSELLFSAAEVMQATQRLADEISAALGGEQPLILSVMGGAVVFTGQLLPLLNFPLDFDYVHATRYGKEKHGSRLEWKVLPRENVDGRIILVLDDILDEGYTLSAIRDKVLALGARKFMSAVFADKQIDKPKPVKADFVGINVPNRFVFGFGMDISGCWRNLPAIYALK